MKKFVTLALVALFASSAVAGLDPGTDSFGVYFDTAGNTNTITAAPFAAFPAYLLLMNPSGPTNGFECTVTPSGPSYFLLSTDVGSTMIDIDGSANGFAVGAATDYPIVSGAIKLVTWSIMVMSPTPALEFRITKALQPSLPGNLPVVTGDGILRQCGVSSGDVTVPVAYVNGTNQPIATEVSTFGAVKGLFR